jgi:ribosomal-protein-alanine N-acetyltransferase
MIPVIESKRLYYRPLSMDHCSQAYVNWMNDAEVNQFLESGGNYTIEQLEAYLKSVVEKENMFFWAIHIKENDEHIGNIKIDPINKKHGHGEYGILMGAKEYWGKGYAKEASLTIIDYCFNETGLRKMTLGVVEKNIAAVELYKKLGFEVEGVYKKHGIYNGEYCDIFRMALFNPSFKELT